MVQVLFGVFIGLVVMAAYAVAKTGARPTPPMPTDKEVDEFERELWRRNLKKINHN
jgi:hypothetical protein